MLKPTEKAKAILAEHNIELTKLDENGQEVLKPLEEMIPLFSKLSTSELLMVFATQRAIKSGISLVRLFEDYKVILGEVRANVDELTPSLGKMMATIWAQAGLARNALQELFTRFYNIIKEPIAEKFNKIAVSINRLTDYLFENINL